MIPDNNVSSNHTQNSIHNNYQSNEQTRYLSNIDCSNELLQITRPSLNYTEQYIHNKAIWHSNAHANANAQRRLPQSASKNTKTQNSHKPQPNIPNNNLQNRSINNTINNTNTSQLINASFNWDKHWTPKTEFVFSNKFQHSNSQKKLNTPYKQNPNNISSTTYNNYTNLSNTSQVYSSVDPYWQRRENETQMKLNEIRNSEYLREQNEIRDKPQISKNSQRIANRLRSKSSEKVFDRLTNGSHERKKIWEINQIAKITNPSYEPKINQSSQRIKRTVDDWYQWKTQVERKKTETSNYITSLNEKNTPVICEGSENIMKNKTQYLNKKVEDRLLEQGEIIKNKKEEKKERYIENIMKPILYVEGENMYGNVESRYMEETKCKSNESKNKSKDKGKGKGKVTRPMITVEKAQKMGMNHNIKNIKQNQNSLRNNDLGWYDYHRDKIPKAMTHVQSNNSWKSTSNTYRTQVNQTSYDKKQKLNSNANHTQLKQATASKKTEMVKFIQKQDVQSEVYQENDNLVDCQEQEPEIKQPPNAYILGTHQSHQSNQSNQSHQSKPEWNEMMNIRKHLNQFYEGKSKQINNSFSNNQHTPPQHLRPGTSNTIPLERTFTDNRDNYVLRQPRNPEQRDHDSGKYWDKNCSYKEQLYEDEINYEVPINEPKHINNVNTQSSQVKAISTYDENTKTNSNVKSNNHSSLMERVDNYIQEYDYLKQQKEYTHYNNRNYTGNRTTDDKQEQMLMTKPNYNFNSNILSHFTKQQPCKIEHIQDNTFNHPKIMEHTYQPYNMNTNQNSTSNYNEHQDIWNKDQPNINKRTQDIEQMMNFASNLREKMPFNGYGYPEGIVQNNNLNIPSLYTTDIDNLNTLNEQLRKNTTNKEAVYRKITGYSQYPTQYKSKNFQ